MLDVAVPPGTPWGEEWRPSRDFRSVAELYTARNGRALRALFGKWYLASVQVVGYGDRPGAKARSVSRATTRR